MKIELGDLTVKFNEEASDKLTRDWTWLVGTDKKVLLISAIGDMFIADIAGKVYWLDCGGGKLNLIAATIQEFKDKLTDIDKVNEWFLIDLTTELRNSSKKLKDGQVYSFKKLPVVGGDYTADNFAPIDIEEHFGYTGHIHKEIKDLPDGTRVEIKIVD